MLQMVECDYCIGVFIVAFTGLTGHTGNVTTSV